MKRALACLALAALAVGCSSFSAVVPQRRFCDVDADVCQKAIDAVVAKAPANERSTVAIVARRLRLEDGGVSLLMSYEENWLVAFAPLYGARDHEFPTTWEVAPSFDRVELWTDEFPPPAHFRRLALNAGLMSPPTPGCCAQPDPIEGYSSLYLENGGGPRYTVMINGEQAAKVDCGESRVLAAGLDNVPVLPWELTIFRERDGRVLTSQTVGDLPKFFSQVGEFAPVRLTDVAFNGPLPTCPPA